MRSGDAYVASLRDGRAVFLDGERVDDVTKHPGFAEPIRRIAQTWDLAAAPEAQADTTYVDPETGRRHSAMWLVPRSAEDLGARRRVHRLWAEPSYGLMGRTPDHVACVMTVAGDPEWPRRLLAGFEGREEVPPPGGEPG